MFGSDDANNPVQGRMPGSDAPAYTNPASHHVTPISSNVDTPLASSSQPLAPPSAPPPPPDLQLPPDLHMQDPPLPHAAPPPQAAQQHMPPDNLMQLKQQAIQNLQPLVTHLEQTPEEKFKTTMMLIQASDNANLIKDAYEAAQRISDEKARAQALIDIVNEINYFTQHKNQAQ
jgi:hypothetical protein